MKTMTAAEAAKKLHSICANYATMAWLISKQMPEGQRVAPEGCGYWIRRETGPTAPEAIMALEKALCARLGETVRIGQPETTTTKQENER